MATNSDPERLEDISATVIEERLTDGGFTPYLGPGVVSLRPQRIDLESAPWDKLGDNLACLCQALAVRQESAKVPDGTNKWRDALRYLQAFVQDRVCLDDANWNQVSTGKKTSLCSSDFGRLLEFQAVLVKILAALTRVYGNRFAEDCLPVRKLRQLKLPLTPHEQTDSLTAFQDLIAALVPDDPFPEINEHSGFGSAEEYRKAVGSKLLWAIHELTSHEVRVSQKFDLFLSENEDLRMILSRQMRDPDNDAKGFLRLDLLEWLAQLLWHTLTYRIQRPPTTNELSFSLSLECFVNAPPRMIELAQAAQLVARKDKSANELRKRIKKWYGSQERQAEGNIAIDLHRVLAAASFHQYLVYQDKINESPRVDPSSHVTGNWDEDQPRSAIPLPLIFTTNFDEALEGIFEGAKVPHHLVFPCTDGSGSVQWWFHTPRFRGGSEGEEKSPRWTEYLEANKAIDKTAKLADGLKLLGPVIVKLHGSPETAEPPSFQHHVILSEETYLRSLAESANLPDWIKQQLSDDCCRFYLFLGFALDDWNVRMELFKSRRLPNANHSPNRRKATAPFGRTLDLEADPVQRILLEDLDVGIWTGDLHELSKRLRAAIPKLPRKEEERKKNALLGNQSS